MISSPLTCLVYSSTAVHPMVEEELRELLRQSRRNNQRDGITGLLLYKNEMFMQLLEGPEDVVLECYSRIAQDPRHQGVLALLQKVIRHRFFAQWSMAFHCVDCPSINLNQTEDDLSPFLNEPYTGFELGEEIHEGLFLLLSFKKQMSDRALMSQTHLKVPSGEPSDDLENQARQEEARKAPYLSRMSRGVIEEYTLNGHHFTRSILIPPEGGRCVELFAVDEDEVEQSNWFVLLDQARKKTTQASWVSL